MADDSVDTRLGRIEGQLSIMISMQSEHNALTAKLATRVSTLERSKSYFLGAAAVIGAGVSFAITKLKGI